MMQDPTKAICYWNGLIKNVESDFLATPELQQLQMIDEYCLQIYFSLMAHSGQLIICSTK